MMGIANFSSYAKRVSRAYRNVDGDATPAQREALNYRHGKVHLHGLDLMIECPRGGVRTGTSSDGKTWKRVMNAGYGRIKRTIGRDGEPVDVFIGEHPESQLVFVISQLDKDGNLDEHKCVLGTRNVDEARKLYLGNYPDFWEHERLGEIRGYFMPQFREWLKTDAPRKNSRKKEARDYVEGEDCPRCGASLERDPYSGTCNSCGKDWPLKEKKAAIPHDDGEVCSTCGACLTEKHTGASHDCGAIQPMVESRLKRTEQGLPNVARNKSAEDLGECPLCRKSDNVSWHNDALKMCSACDHKWFAHMKRGSSTTCPYCGSNATKMMSGPVADMARVCTDCGQKWVDGFQEKMRPQNGNKDTCPSVARLLNYHKVATARRPS